MDTSVLLQKLDIPSVFRNYNSAEDSATIIRLEEWRRQAHTVLVELREQYKNRETLSRGEEASIIASAAPFDGDGPWTFEPSRAEAQGV